MIDSRHNEISNFAEFKKHVPDWDKDTFDEQKFTYGGLYLFRKVAGNGLFMQNKSN